MDVALPVHTFSAITLLASDRDGATRLFGCCRYHGIIFALIPESQQSLEEILTCVIGWKT
jgi:hypothetical protein